MKIPGVKKARLFSSWVRSRFSGGALVLGYHRVADTVDDPYGLCVKPSHFKEQISILASRANPIPLEQLGEALLNRDIPPRAVVVTFDDGYVDNFESALPILTDYGIPASFFIVTGNMGRPFWWDELAELMLGEYEWPHQNAIKLAETTVAWPPKQQPRLVESQTGQARRSLLLEFYDRLLAIEPNARQSILDELKIASSGHFAGKFGTPRAMSTTELSRLAQSNVATIGSHTHNHPILPSLSVAAQVDEILTSKERLEELINQPVTSFSYPNSNSSPSTRQVLEECGFVLAFGSSNGSAGPGSDPLLLPRFWIPDWDGKRFGRWLDTWLMD